MNLQRVIAMREMRTQTTINDRLEQELGLAKSRLMIANALSETDRPVFLSGEFVRATLDFAI